MSIPCCRTRPTPGRRSSAAMSRCRGSLPCDRRAGVRRCPSDRPATFRPRRGNGLRFPFRPWLTSTCSTAPRHNWPRTGSVRGRGCPAPGISSRGSLSARSAAMPSAAVTISTVHARHSTITGIIGAVEPRASGSMARADAMVRASRSMSSTRRSGTRCVTCCAIRPASSMSINGVWRRRDGSVSRVKPIPSAARSPSFAGASSA